MEQLERSEHRDTNISVIHRSTIGLARIEYKIHIEELKPSQLSASGRSVDKSTVV